MKSIVRNWFRNTNYRKNGVNRNWFKAQDL